MAARTVPADVHTATVQCDRQRGQGDEEGDDQEEAHGAMLRAVYVTGRILAAVAAVRLVTVLVITAVSIARAGECSGPDCDDIAFERALERAMVLVPVSALVGAAGVALVHDTRRKI